MNGFSFFCYNVQSEEQFEKGRFEIRHTDLAIQKQSVTGNVANRAQDELKWSETGSQIGLFVAVNQSNEVDETYVFD